MARSSSFISAPLVIFGIASAVLGILVTLPWESEIYEGFEWVPGHTENTGDLNTDKYSRRTIHFTSQGDKIEAWLYMPHANTAEESGESVHGKVPIVIMAHGMGAQRDFGLHKNAEAFASHGFAIMVFDYR